VLVERKKQVGLQVVLIFVMPRDVLGCFCGFKIERHRGIFVGNVRGCF